MYTRTNSNQPYILPNTEQYLNLIRYLCLQVPGIIVGVYAPSMRYNELLNFYNNIIATTPESVFEYSPRDCTYKILFDNGSYIESLRENKKYNYIMLDRGQSPDDIMDVIESKNVEIDSFLNTFILKQNNH